MTRSEVKWSERPAQKRREKHTEKNGRALYLKQMQKKQTHTHIYAHRNKQMKISKSRYKWFAYLSTFIQIKMYEVEQKQKDADMEPTIFTSKCFECWRRDRLVVFFLLLLIEGNFMFENYKTMLLCLNSLAWFIRYRCLRSDFGRGHPTKLATKCTLHI